MADKVSWDYSEGDAIVRGRRAVYLLGGGTRAEAWVAWDERLHALVVVKILRPSHLDDGPAREALTREARVLRELQHPAIVRCFAAELDGPRPHLVLESLDGPRLSTLVRRYGPLAPEQLVPLGLEIASALAFMHDSGYVHLDVKPRNLIVSATPRLIDLGIARTLAEIGELATPPGTPAYMAPEQCRPETLAQLGPPADVWALGVVLYSAAIGRHPYAGAAGGPEAQPQLHSQPAALDERRVPPPLAEIIRGCLEPMPADRPSAAQVGERLEPLLVDARRVARRRLRGRKR